MRRQSGAGPVQGRRTARSLWRHLDGASCSPRAVTEPQPAARPASLCLCTDATLPTSTSALLAAITAFPGRGSTAFVVNPQVRERRPRLTPPRRPEPAPPPARPSLQPNGHPASHRRVDRGLGPVRSTGTARAAGNPRGVFVGAARLGEGDQLRLTVLPRDRPPARGTTERLDFRSFGSSNSFLDDQSPADRDRPVDIGRPSGHDEPPDGRHGDLGEHLGDVAGAAAL